MSSLLLSGGRVIDPANRLDAVADVLIRDGRIAAVGAGAAQQADAETVRRTGWWCVRG
jgi:dihydroorotase